VSYRGALVLSPQMQNITFVFIQLLCALFSLYEIFVNVNTKLGSAAKGYCNLSGKWGNNQTCWL